MLSRRPDHVGGIFISYRRSDTSTEAEWLAKILARQFGRRRVFLDRDGHSLSPGDKFATEIKNRLTSADVVLALVGPDWTVLEADSSAAIGTGRVPGPSYWVTRELTLAIENGLPVAPVLVVRNRSRPVPWPPELPTALASLADVHTYTLGEIFERDAEDLATRLVPLVPDDRSMVRRQFDRWGQQVARVGAVAAIAALVVWIGLTRFLPEPAPEQMDGTFNIAVSPIDDSALTGDGATSAASDGAGDAIGAAIAGALAGEFDDEALVWGPPKVDAVQGASPNERRDHGYRIAAQIGADILIYGTMTPDAGPLVRVHFDMTVRSSDERRPADPLVFEGSLGTTDPIDPTRIDTPAEAIAALQQLVIFREIVDALRLLDRDEPERAIGRLETAGEAVGTAQNDVAAIVHSLRGVSELRLAELGGSPGALGRGIAELEQALVLQPDSGFAQVWLLGGRYLRALGPDRESVSDLAMVDLAELLAVRSDLIALAESNDGTTNALTAIQARNVASQIDIVRHRVSSDADEQAELLDAAEIQLRAIDASFTSPPNGLRTPELQLVVSTARSSLGFVYALRGDHEQALVWFEAARDIASPLNLALESAKIGWTLLILDRPCDAQSDLELALSLRDSDGNPWLRGESRETIEAQLQAAKQSVCTS